ncbi:Epithelial cell-transforming sequence 2 oncogene-like [Varanus komodoensis]|nr:Epithelial cell-transforming sequence 2 oncogene-like [Varanus komodoensis]
MTTPYTTCTPHSVKQWHLESLGLLAEDTKSPIQNQKMEILNTRFSTWTPIENHSLNNQLFQERVRLISHWFDLWTDKQRKQFLHWILTKCNKSQLRFAEKWFVENTPLTKVDFTTLLPRFISLYIFSFLNPKDLCAAAQVNWHWKFLTEQDCVWMPKCIKLGWFLPYTPEKNEYSAWKQYYIACAMNLDCLAPRKAVECYETLNDPKMENEDQEERIRAKYLRKIIREKLVLQKKELLKARPPWISGTQNSGFNKSGFQPNLSHTVRDKAKLPERLLLMKLQKRMISPKDMLSKQISEDVPSASSFSLEAQIPLTSLKSFPKRYPNGMHSLQPHLVLISSHVPANEMILSSLKPGVVPVLYEHCGTTLDCLLYYIEKALDGQKAKSIGIISDGDSREINLLQGYRISTMNLLKPEVRAFWEKLRNYISSPEEGSHINIFVPLAASGLIITLCRKDNNFPETGMEVLSQLSHLTGVLFRAPTGIATGSYQHILSEWLGNQKDSPPPSLYFTEEKFQIWLRFTELLEDALKAVKKKLRPYFCDLKKNIAGKILGQIMFETVSWCELQDNRRIAQAFADGLVEASRGNHENPLEFLSYFLMKKYNTNDKLKNKIFLSESNPEANLPAPVKSGKLLEDTADRRKILAGELMLSEKEYMDSLEIIRDVYVKPLKAALASNRAILSYASVQLIFSDILNILQLNRCFFDELTERLKEWSPAQNLGDVFIKFGQQLQTYTNFYNNYAVILKTIDKCRETIPVFRAFLKRHDKTVVTAMRSLQELLLCPSKRVEAYVTLLYALRLHTPPEHTDREDLSAAIKQMKQYKDYLEQLKLNVDREDQILSMQRLIQGCPQLLKANRYLIRTQDVAQLSKYSERVDLPFRIYQHTCNLSLFLFNDILVISQRSISYKPFQRIPKTTHHFLSVVTLLQLLVEDIPDSKCMFLLP